MEHHLAMQGGYGGIPQPMYQAPAERYVVVEQAEMMMMQWVPAAGWVPHNWMVPVPIMHNNTPPAMAIAAIMHGDEMSQLTGKHDFDLHDEMAQLTVNSC